MFFLFLQVPPKKAKKNENEPEPAEALAESQSSEPKTHRHLYLYVRSSKMMSGWACTSYGFVAKYRFQIEDNLRTLLFLLAGSKGR